jgi:hypothetical protein
MKGLINERSSIVDSTKRFWYSKTFWFNILALVVAVAGVFGFTDFIPTEEIQGHISAVSVLVAAAIPVVNIILRFVTSAKLTL